jgi:hypothetical protein
MASTPAMVITCRYLMDSLGGPSSQAIQGSSRVIKTAPEEDLLGQI